MKLLPVWIRRFGQRMNSSNSLGELPDLIKNMLDRRRREIREVNSDTAHQWDLLAHAMERRTEPSALPRRSFRVRPLRMAVPVAAIALGIILYVGFWPRALVPETYRTTKGQRTTVLLPDSSEVSLNHTSTLTIVDRTFNNSRHVRLTGEALFRVRKNGTPFVIVTDIARIRVVGTEFDVRARDGRLEVGVLEGIVNISVDRGGKDSTVILGGGQQTTCAMSGYPQVPTRLETTGYPGWMSGRMVFARASFEAVCEEIESTFGIIIRVENPRIRGETITGALDARNLGTALATLTRLTGTKYRNENGTYIFY